MPDDMRTTKVGHLRIAVDIGGTFTDLASAVIGAVAGCLAL